MGRKPTKNLNLPTGMRRRDKPSGKTYYYLDTGGRPRKEIPLGSDYILAIQKYAELVKTHQAEAVTFGHIINEWIKVELPKKKASTQRTLRYDLRHLTFAFKDAPLAAVKPVVIRQFMTQLRDRPSLANRCKSWLRVIWNWGRESGYTELPNPADGIPNFKMEKRTLYVSDELYLMLRESANSALQEAMDLAYLTGQRPSDLMAMTEHDIREGFIFVEQIKTGARLRLQVTPEIEAVLKRIRARKQSLKVHHTRLLVNERGDPLQVGSLQRYVTLARQKAAQAHPEHAEELLSMWFYDLRSKAADDTAEMAGDSVQASHLLGHSDTRMTEAHYIRRARRVDSMLKIPVRKDKKQGGAS